MALTDATAECPLCGEEAYATGVTEAKHEKTMLEMECSMCHYKFVTWRREWEKQGLIPQSEGYAEWLKSIQG